MERFEYEITTHPSETFNTVAYFCSENGECSVEDVNQEQTRILSEILNKRGSKGWELVQTSFRKKGIMIFWKRKIVE